MILKGSCELLIFLVILGNALCTQKILKTITFDPEKGWTHGFLLPPDQQVDSIIYDFEQSQKSTHRRFQITLTFHEYYHSYEVIVCSTEGIFKAHDAVDFDFPSPSASRTISIYQNSCRWIDPLLYQIYTFSGPAFVEVLKTSPFEHLPDRIQLLLNVATHKLYNFTYELSLVDKTRAKVSPSRISKDLIDHHPCSLNGILVLQQKNVSWFEFECECKLETYGESCQWDKFCSKENSRKLCFDRGTCRALAGFEKSKFCECDEGYYESKCIPYTAFPTDWDCQNATCHFCHELPNRERRCSCTRGFRLSDSGLCEEDFTNITLYYGFHQEVNPTEDLVKLKVRSLFSCDHEIHSGKLTNETLRIDPRLNKLVLLNAPGSLLVDDLVIGRDGKVVPKCEALLEHVVSNDSEALDWVANATIILADDLLVNSLVIETFRWTSFAGKLRICCSAARKGVLFSFFKDDVLINVKPFNNSNCDTSWHQGYLEIDCTQNLPVDVCLVMPLDSAVDFGIYQCQVDDGYFIESKYLIVKEDKTTIKISPKYTATIMGQNVTVNCSWELSTSLFQPLKPIWRVAPVGNFESYSFYPSHFRGSYLIVHNVKDDVSVTCGISDKFNKTYAESKSYIRVLTLSDFVCRPEVAYNMTWQLTQMYNMTETVCPHGFVGSCSRQCSLDRSKSVPSWELPDCSKCRRENVFVMFQNYTLFKRGFWSYLPHPKNFFRELKNELPLNHPILPGEIGNILNHLSDALLLPEMVPNIDDFYSFISYAISTRGAIRDQDLQYVEELLLQFPIHLTDETCLLKKSVHENIVFFLQKSSIQHEIFNVTNFFESDKRQVPELKGVSSVRDERKQLFTGVNVIVRSDHHYQKKSLNILRHPQLLLPYKYSIYGKNSGDYGKHSKDLGEIYSPLIQLGLYGEGEKARPSWAERKLLVTFFQCHFTNIRTSNKLSSTLITCGRFSPTLRIWNLTSCSFVTNGNTCSCSCESVDGWIGLLSIHDQHFTRNVFIWRPNMAVTWGCSISLFLLALTAVILLVRCGLFSTPVLSRLLEILALFVINLIFLYCSMAKTAEDDHMVVLIMVAGCLVLLLGISVSHQVEILRTSSVIMKSLHQGSFTVQPSLLLVVVSAAMALMLGGILWTIARVQTIRLSHAWLPESEDSSLSLVVLCYISSLLLLACLLTALNCLKLKSIVLNAPKRFADRLSSEFKKCCILGFLEFAFIFTSFYQSKSGGKFAFPVVTVMLSLAFLVIYTCSNLTCNEIVSCKLPVCKDDPAKKKYRFSSTKNFCLKWISPPVELYSGVVGTEMSRDESLDLNERIDTNWLTSFASRVEDLSSNKSNGLGGSHNYEAANYNTRDSFTNLEVDYFCKNVITCDYSKQVDTIGQPSGLSTLHTNRSCKAVLPSLRPTEINYCLENSNFLNTEGRYLSMEGRRGGMNHGGKYPSLGKRKMSNYINLPLTLHDDKVQYQKTFTSKQTQITSGSKSEDTSPHIARTINPSRARSASVISFPHAEKSRGVLSDFSSKQCHITSQSESNYLFDASKLNSLDSEFYDSTLKAIPHDCESAKEEFRKRQHSF